MRRSRLPICTLHAEARRPIPSAAQKIEPETPAEIEPETPAIVGSTGEGNAADGSTTPVALLPSAVLELFAAAEADMPEAAPPPSDVAAAEEEAHASTAEAVDGHAPEQQAPDALAFVAADAPVPVEAPPPSDATAAEGEEAPASTAETDDGRANEDEQQAPATTAARDGEVWRLEEWVKDKCPVCATAVLSEHEVKTGRRNVHDEEGKLAGLLTTCLCLFYQRTPDNAAPPLPRLPLQIPGTGPRTS